MATVTAIYRNLRKITTDFVNLYLTCDKYHMFACLSSVCGMSSFICDLYNL